MSATLAMPKLRRTPRTLQMVLPHHPGFAQTSLSRPIQRQYFVSSPIRPLAQPRHVPLTEPWPASGLSPTLFSPTTPHLSVTDGPANDPDNKHKPPDERILKLGKNILAPSVTLHLFPSTHPHLPTVKGRTLYRAALWTVPVAWSSLPLVGNVKLQILSERIVRAGTVLDPDGTGEDSGDERLVVRWRTEPRREGDASSPPPPSQAESTNGANKGLSVLLGGDTPIFKLSKEEQFTGLFIFSFDEEGRVASHTIEHAEDAGGWDRTAKFVTLTDWLIGKARGSLDPAGEPGFAMQGCFDIRGRRERRR
ncbi:hypothetical protein BDV59DRAFT_3470 [Aspergillus ambiguus]|uniref:uncharacterized protein n=1 Tax=Aspergillus ambiguus TaxID=176160 RepID=UPI003CCDE09A